MLLKERLGVRAPPKADTRWPHSARADPGGRGLMLCRSVAGLVGPARKQGGVLRSQKEPAGRESTAQRWRLLVALHHGSPCLSDQYLMPILISVGFLTANQQFPMW